MFFDLGYDASVHFSSPTVPRSRFVWSGLTGSVGSVLGVPATGWILLLVLVAVVALAGVRTVALRQLAVAGIFGAVTQLGSRRSPAW